MQKVRGKRVLRQFTLPKQAYQQQIFQTRSDEMLKRELAGLRKLLSSKQNRENKVNHRFKNESCQNSSEEEGESDHSYVAALDEVNRANQNDRKWDLIDDNSFVKVSENYSSSSQSWPSPEKSFQNIKLPEKKIKISDYLEQIRKLEMESSTTIEQSKSLIQ